MKMRMRIDKRTKITDIDIFRHRQCRVQNSVPSHRMSVFAFGGRFLSFGVLPLTKVYTGHGRFELPWVPTESQKRPVPTKRQKEPGRIVFWWALFGKWAENIPASVGSKYACMRTLAHDH